MAAPKPRPGLRERTPIAEWVAAALGLILTVAMLGYFVREAVTDQEGPPLLVVSRGAATPTDGGFVVPVIVSNRGDATAADVEILGALERGGQVIEERRLSFSYVPAGGEARGGLLFQANPTDGRLEITPEGFAEP